MGNRFKGLIMGASAVVAGVWLFSIAAPGQAPAPAYKAPRTKDGKADLNGIWQVLNEANWDVRPHAAAQGPYLMLGAQFSEPPGVGVVDGDLPYLPAAEAKQKENFTNRMKLDPEVKCYLAGVPRATYMPYPFQIVQGTQTSCSPMSTPEVRVSIWTSLRRLRLIAGWGGRTAIGKATRWW